MATDVYDDAIVDVVGEETLVTNTVTVKVGSVSESRTIRSRLLGSSSRDPDPTIPQFLFLFYTHRDTA